MIECIFISTILNLSPHGQKSLPIPEASKIKMASSIKGPFFFALNGQNNLWGCFHKRKRMFCRIKASGDWCTTQLGLRNEWSQKRFSPAQLEVWVWVSRESSGHVVFQSSVVFELLSAIVWPAWSGWHGSQLCVRSVVLCWLRKEWSRKGFSHTRPRVWVQVCRRSPGHVVFHSSGFFFAIHHYQTCPNHPSCVFVKG